MRERQNAKRVRALRVVAMLIAGFTLPGTDLSTQAAELNFDGVVEPRQRVQIANQVSAVVKSIKVAPGERVEKGAVLFELDPAAFEIDLAEARARLAEAQARLFLAKDVEQRQRELMDRGSGLAAKARQSEIEVEIARAVVAREESSLAHAKLALERTRILAPISGTMGRPHVAPGAFVEAEGGTQLGEIVALDPILVAYRVSYADRQSFLMLAGTSSAEEMFGKITLSLTLPSQEIYAHAGQPRFESAEIDPATGVLTTWGEFPNPDGTLVPGLQVRVHSTIGTPAAPAPRAQ